MKMKLTIKSLLAMSLAMLIGMFSLQSFADKDDQFNATGYELAELDEDSMIPDEEELEEDEDVVKEPLSQSDDVDAESDNDEDKDQSGNNQLIFG